MNEKIIRSSLVFLASIFFVLNTKIYSTEVCFENKAEKIDEYANYILEKSTQNLNIEEREKIRNCAYKLCVAYSKLKDVKNYNLWYAHYLRLSAGVHIARALETGALDEWSLANSELVKCANYYSKIKFYKEAKPFIPYAYGAIAKVKYQIARILNSPESWGDAEQSFDTAVIFFSVCDIVSEKNNSKFFSLLSECRESLERSAASKRASSLFELKTILFELTEKSKDIKANSITIKNYESAYDIISKIYYCFRRSNVALLCESSELLHDFEMCMKILPEPNIESRELFDRFIFLMKRFLNKMSWCHRL